VPAIGSDQQGGIAAVAASVDAGTAPQQGGNGVYLPAIGRQHERRISELGGRLRIRTALEQGFQAGGGSCGGGATEQVLPIRAACPG
jgi:hypothetical protein